MGFKLHSKFGLMFLLTLVINGFGQIPDTLWTKTYGGIYGEFTNSVIQTFDGADYKFIL
jgi:hypothetical protein